MYVISLDSNEILKSNQLHTKSIINFFYIGSHENILTTGKDGRLVLSQFDNLEMIKDIQFKVYLGPALVKEET